MAHQPIDHGSTAGDGQGEALFSAFQKVNANDAELYGAKTVFVANYAALPVTGEVGKIYVTLDDDAMYRWTGTVYDDLGGIQFVANQAALPATGEALKVYITLDTGVQYRWTGSAYLALTFGVATGVNGGAMLAGADGATIKILQHYKSLGVLGDSLASNNADVVGIPYSYAMIEGGFRTALMQTGYVGGIENDGVGGETSTQIAARKANVTADIVVVYAGTNDINNAGSAGDITVVLTALKTKLAETWDYLIGRGKTVIATTIPPKGTSGGLSAAGWSSNQLTMQIEANRWIREQAAARGMRVFEQFIPLVDPNSAGLAPKLNMLRDGTHLSSQGALAAAKYNRPWLVDMFGVPTLEIGSLLDSSVYQNGGAKNLMDNSALIAGTGGQATVGSGTINGSAVNVNPDALIPQDWRVFNAAGTQAVATSIVPNPAEGMSRGQWVTGEYYGGGDYATDSGVLYRAVVTHLAGATLAGDILKWEAVQPAAYAMQFNITGADATTNVQLYPKLTTPSTRIALGKYLYTEAIVDILSATNMKPPALKQDFSFGTAIAGFTQRTANAGVTGAGATVHPMPERGRFLLRTPKIYADPAGVSIAASQLFFLNFGFSGAGSAVVRVSQPRTIMTD